MGTISQKFTTKLKHQKATRSSLISEAIILDQNGPAAYRQIFGANMGWYVHGMSQD